MVKQHLCLPNQLARRRAIRDLRHTERPCAVQISEMQAYVKQYHTTQFALAARLVSIAREFVFVMQREKLYSVLRIIYQKPSHSHAGKLFKSTCWE